jgi:hypothetical protein
MSLPRGSHVTAASLNGCEHRPLPLNRRVEERAQLLFFSLTLPAATVLSAIPHLTRDSYSVLEGPGSLSSPPTWLGRPPCASWHSALR